MKQILKWSAIIGAGLIVLVILALLLIPMFVDVTKFKPLVEAQVSKATGRPFAVGDDVKLSLFPWAGLTFSDLRLGNPPDFAEKDFVAVKSLDVQFKLVPLIFRDIQVRRFILNEPRIVLLKNDQGRVNWEIGPPKAATQSGSAAPGRTGGFELPFKDLAVGEFAVTRGSAVWIDQTRKLRQQATEIELRLKDVTLDQPVKIFFTGRLDNRLLSLTGTVGPLGKQIGQNPIGLNISLAALEELKMKVTGQVENPLDSPKADLAIDVAEFSPRRLLAALNQPFPIITADPKALSRLAFSGRLKADQNRLAISDGKLKLDDSKSSLTLNIVNFKHPDLTFDLALDQIDADRYMPPPTRAVKNEVRPAVKAKADGAKTVSSPTPNPVSWPLAAVDGRLQAGKVMINQKKIEDIRMTLNGKSGPIKLALSARLPEGPLGINGSIGPLGAEAGRQTLPLDLTVTAVDQLRLRASGKVSNPMQQPVAELAVKIDEFSPRKLLAAFGQPLSVATPDPAAINRAALAANIKADANTVVITDGQLLLDDSRAQVTLRALDLARPNVTFDLAVDQINLDRYLPLQALERSGGAKPAATTQDGAKQPAAKPSVAGSGPDYEPLRRLALTGQVQAGKLTVNNLKIANLQLKISAAKGVIKFDPMTMNLYQGSLAGKGQCDVRQKEPVSDVDLTVDQVQIGPLLKDLANQEILEGVTQARVNLTLTGDTAERIRQTLNGQGQLKFSDGAFKGFDLAAMARNVESALGLGTKDTPADKRPRTDFTELNVPFTITNGIVDLAKANMKSPFIRLEASGKADLVKETLNFLVDPQGVATIKGQGDEKARTGILVPIIVSGTFNAPELRPDFKRILTRQADSGLLESEPVKKVFEQKDLKPFEEPAKKMLKDTLKKP